MNKSEIRKKILKIRKQNNFKNFDISFESIFKILKKEKITGKTVGGYYPYNYEVDATKILKKLEKKKLFNLSAKNKKKLSDGFFSMVIKRSINNK